MVLAQAILGLLSAKRLMRCLNFCFFFCTGYCKNYCRNNRILAFLFFSVEYIIFTMDGSSLLSQKVNPLEYLHLQ